MVLMSGDPGRRDVEGEINYGWRKLGLQCLALYQSSTKYTRVEINANDAELRVILLFLASAQ